MKYPFFFSNQIKDFHNCTINQVNYNLLMRLLITTLLSLFSLIKTFNNPICRGKRYYCSTDNKPLTCVNVTDPKGKVHNLSTCPTDYYCPYWEAGIGKAVSCKSSWENQTIGNITTLVNLNKTYILPGESCSQNNDCITNACVGGVCKGAALNASCAKHEDCDPGLFCSSLVCKTQVAFNEV